MKLRKLLIFWAWIYILFFISAVISGSFAREFSAGYMQSTLAHYLPGLSMESIQRLVTIIRKSIHLLGYSGLGISSYFVLGDADWFRRSPYVGGLMMGLVVAAFDELLQVWSPFRTGSIVDVFLDLLGVLLGLAVVKVIEIVFPDLLAAERDQP